MTTKDAKRHSLRSFVCRMLLHASPPAEREGIDDDRDDDERQDDHHYASSRRSQFLIGWEERERQPR